LNLSAMKVSVSGFAGCLISRFATQIFCVPLVLNVSDCLCYKWFESIKVIDLTVLCFSQLLAIGVRWRILCQH